MSTLYVIGNGFDKAHEIHTDYWDFRIFLEENYPEFLQEFERMYNIMPLDDSEPYYTVAAQKRWEKSVNQEFWSIFEGKIGYPDIAGMEGFSSCVLNDLDLESGNVGIQDTMDQYWKREYGFIHQLQAYLKEWISTVDLSNAKPRKSELIENNSDYFLNFNYTETLEKIYHIEGVVHIHGGIGIASDVDPIIGHCNKEEIEQRRILAQKADEAFDEGEASIQNAIVNYLCATFKDTDFIIKQHEFFFKELCAVDHVVLIGWSVGDVDILYLRKIRDTVKKGSQWTICYYREDERDTIRDTLTQNEIYKNFEVNFLQTDKYWDC